MNEWDTKDKRPKFFEKPYENLLEIIESLRRWDDEQNQIPQSIISFLEESDTGRLIWFFWFRYHLWFRDDAKYSGNLGYGIRPSERWKWYATTWLWLRLEQIRKLGYQEIIIACRDDNSPSYKTIEKNGGKLLEIVTLPNGEVRRRYRVGLNKDEKELLQSLEIELLQVKTRRNPDRIDALLADDFFECGKYGDQFGKWEVLDALTKESNDKKFEIQDISVNMLSETLGQVRYLCTIENSWESPTISFRSSLWRKGESWWQMFYHQGTLLKLNN